MTRAFSHFRNLEYLAGFVIATSTILLKRISLSLRGVNGTGPPPTKIIDASRRSDELRRA
jgi:hypothetical protein